MTKPYTEDEVRDMFLLYIHDLVSYWDSVDDRACREKLRGLAFSILVTLDGESVSLPTFKVVPCPHPDDREYHQSYEVDIGRESLHERFYSIMEES